MNAKVGLKEVQAYAKTHNVDFRTAAQKLGLTKEETLALESLGGDPGAPVDGFQKKPLSYTLKSGRKVKVFTNQDNTHTYRYYAADGTELKESYFLKKEGMTGKHFAIDSKGVLVSVSNEAEPEPSFFAKVANKVKKDVKGYVQNFTNAWNNSEGVVETTGKLVGAATKTATDVVKNSADNIEKGVAEVTGSETAGTIARYASGVGVVADAAKGIERMGDWSADKIREKAKEYTGSNKELLLAFADFVDNMNAADIALIFAGGAGVAKFAKELPKIMKLLGLGGAVTVALASCTNETNIKQETAVYIPAQDQSALTAAFKEGYEALIAEMKKLGYTFSEYGDQIVNLVTQSNSYLAGISEDMKQNNKDNAAILKMLTNINSTVEVISDLVAATNENITVNGESIKGQLTEILNAIKSGQANTEAKLDAYMEKLRALLMVVIEQQGDQINVSKDSNTTLNAILEKLNKMDGTTQEKLTAILEVLGSIESIGNEINSKIDAIINKFEAQFNDNKQIKASLAKIEAYLEKNNEKTDVTNELLTKLLNKYQSGGLSEEDLQKILDAIAANGDKIDTTNKLITKYGTDTAAQLADILAAIKNIKTGDCGDKLEALLDKVLAKMDANTDDIIAAIGNIKVDGGKVDLSSIEKMLAELTELAGKNNNILTNIDAKMDVLNATAQAIYDKLGNVDQNVQNILDYLKNNVGKYDDSELLKKLDTMTGKLDDILAAIKDHKVTVDVTGKVTCECNCGQSHEGVLGDLESILS